MRLPQQKNGARVGLKTLLSLDAVATSIGIGLLAARGAARGAIPAMLHVGGVEHQCATTVIHPHLELGDAHTYGGEAVVDVTVGGENVWEENRMPLNRDVLAYLLEAERAIANQT